MNPLAPIPGRFALFWLIIYFAATSSLLPPVLFFEQGSDGLIVNSLQASANSNPPSLFMIREDPREDGKSVPYLSQFGLTYRALLPFREYLPITLLPFLLSLVWAIATGAIFWWFRNVVQIAHGHVASFTFLLLLVATPTFLFFSGSFYWQLPLLVAPFLVSYTYSVAAPVFATVWIFSLLFLRFLGGYEYTSTLILSPIAATALRSAFDEIPLRRAFTLSVWFGVAGTLAFAAAMALHVTELARNAGGFEEGIASFRAVAESRTSGDFLGRTPTLKNDVIAFINSFFRNEIILVLGLAALTVYLEAITHGKRTAQRIAASLGFAFLCSISWQLLARGHMRDHAHINFIIYFIPFGLSVYLTFSRIVGTLVSSHKRLLELHPDHSSKETSQIS